jgi:ectoine hydroxylase-related dioxygenase (phytanoyl-CoA dioxygenase family)
MSSEPVRPTAPPAIDLDAYSRDGYSVLGRIADADTVARLRAEEQRFRLDVGYGGADNQTLRVQVQLCHRSEAIRRFCTEGAHLDAVCAVLGPDVCLLHQQFVTKLPDGDDQHSDIPFHQDAGYGRLDPLVDCTIWMPLVDTDAENGAILLVPGSHRPGLLDHGSADVNPVLREASVDEEPVLLPLEAGCAVAFTGLTLHGSGPNRSTTPRPALFVRYAPPTAVIVGDDPNDRHLALEDPHTWMVRGEARAQAITEPAQRAR